MKHQSHRSVSKDSLAADERIAAWYARFQSETHDPEVTLGEFSDSLDQLIRSATTANQGCTGASLNALAGHSERLANTISGPSQREPSIADKLASYTRWLEREATPYRN